MSAKTEHEFRCNCKHHPLLAVYGIEKGGRLYIHIKVYKADRIFAEIYTNETVKVMCRECKRWHQLIIRGRDKPEMKQTLKPTAIPPHVPRGHSLHTTTPNT